MKKFISIVVASLALAGCASAKKQTAPAPQVNAQSSAAQAAPSADSKAQDTAKDAGIVACKKGEEARQLEIVKKGEGCALNYTKAGKTSSAASSVHGTKHCVSSQDKIRKKLEKSGFTCG